MRLSSKVSLTIIPLIMVPLLLVGAYSYYVLWQKNINSSHAQLEYYIDHMKSNYKEAITGATITLKTLASDSLMKQYLLTENEVDRYALMQRPMLAKLTTIQIASPDLFEIRLLLPDGYEELRVTNRTIVNVTDDESSSPFFLELGEKQADFYHFAGISRDTGEHVIYISIPIVLRDRIRDTFTTEPKLRGYLSATLELKHLLFEKIPEPWDLGTTLLSSHNQIFKYNSADALPLSEEMLLSQLSALPLNRWNSITINDTRAQHFAVELTDGLAFHTYIPNKILLTSSLSISNFILGIAVLMLGVTIPLILRFFRRQILLPINNLNLALHKLKAGGEMPYLEQASSCEINQLINSFNHMNSELTRSSKKIRNLAYIDSLTGLPNRTLFHRNLMRAIDHADHDDEILALLYLDLDNFKFVNDNMGHTVGDILLQTVANILRETLRTEDMATRLDKDDDSDISHNADIEEKHHCSRLGGDEFTILLPHLTAPYQAGLVAERIIDAISKPIRINEHTIYVTGSIGIALWSNDTIDANELITFADQAMYQAKCTGKNKFAYFSPTIGEQTRQRAKIEQRLYQATERGCFSVYYQPIVDSLDLKIQSYEALIRWNDEELGTIPPDIFISIAEENGLIMRIGSWVITNVCSQIKQWHESGFDQVRVAVNLSALQINNTNIVHEIQHNIQHYNIPAESLYVELTESSVIKGDEQVLSHLKKLREIGIQIALDDFGTGYSSLGYLRTLPIDILKIDRAFIKDLHEGNNSTILSAIITMAHALNLKVVIEGIEDQDQLKYLPHEKSVFIQGYLFSRPKPAEEAIELLKAQHKVEEKISGSYL